MSRGSWGSRSGWAAFHPPEPGQVDLRPPADPAERLRPSRLNTSRRPTPAEADPPFRASGRVAPPVAQPPGATLRRSGTIPREFYIEIFDRVEIARANLSAVAVNTTPGVVYKLVVYILWACINHFVYYISIYCIVRGDILTGNPLEEDEPMY